MKDLDKFVDKRAVESSEAKMRHSKAIKVCDNIRKVRELCKEENKWKGLESDKRHCAEAELFGVLGEKYSKFVHKNTLGKSNMPWNINVVKYSNDLNNKIRNRTLTEIEYRMLTKAPEKILYKKINEMYANPSKKKIGFFKRLLGYEPYENALQME